jgi:5-methylcytosine-specific restriction protein A
MPILARRSSAESSAVSIRGAGWERTRLRVLLRDGHVCQLCGRQGATSVDHIVPRSRGGTHDMDNLRAACISCNSRRGNRAARPALPAARPKRWRLAR